MRLQSPLEALQVEMQFTRPRKLFLEIPSFVLLLLTLSLGQGLVVRTPIGRANNHTSEVLCEELGKVKSRPFNLCQGLRPKFIKLVNDNVIDGKFYFSTVAISGNQVHMPLKFHMSRLQHTFIHLVSNSSHLLFFTMESMKAHVEELGVAAASIDGDMCDDFHMPERWMAVMKEEWGIKRISTFFKFLVSRYVVELGIDAVFLDADGWLVPPTELIKSEHERDKRVEPWQDDPTASFDYDIISISLVVRSHDLGFQQANGLSINQPRGACSHNLLLGKTCPPMVTPSNDEVSACVCAALIVFKPSEQSKLLLNDLITYLEKFPVWEQDLLAKMLPLHAELGLKVKIMNQLVFKGLATTRAYLFPIPDLVFVHSGNKELRLASHCEAEPDICNLLHPGKPWSLDDLA